MASGNGNSSNGISANGIAPGSAVPKHVAIIMDGNGRWARSRFMPRVEGHRMGAKAVRGIVAEARKQGVRYLTLFAFSTENWYRPGEEVNSLMKLFLHYLENEVNDLIENDIRLRAVGDIKRLPQSVQDALNRSCERTKHGKALDLVLAISYGGRDEIISACKTIVDRVQAGEISANDINEEIFSNNLYTKEIPDPDLLIRTSGECRISNFLLWQVAYSEIVVSPVLWPDFDPKEFNRCLNEYAGRQRRFGLTDEQLSA